MRLSSDQKRVLGTAGRRLIELCVQELAAARIVDTVLPAFSPEMAQRVDAAAFTFAEQQASSAEAAIFAANSGVLMFQIRARNTMRALHDYLEMHRDQRVHTTENPFATEVDKQD